MGSTGRRLLGALVAALALVVAVVALRGRSSEPGTATSVSAGASAPVGPRPMVAHPSPGRGKAKDRRRADAVREDLKKLREKKAHDAQAASSQARAQAEADPPSGASGRMPAPGGSGNQAAGPLGKYIQATVRAQFLPMAKDCYEELLTRVPDAGGKLVLQVTVGGDVSVGGVVESAKLGDRSTLHDDEIVTCFTESMMALVFDAPPEGHDQIDFTYPFVLSPDDDDGGN